MHYSSSIIITCCAFKAPAAARVASTRKTPKSTAKRKSSIGVVDLVLDDDDAADYIDAVGLGNIVVL